MVEGLGSKVYRVDDAYRFCAMGSGLWAVLFMRLIWNFHP